MKQFLALIISVILHAAIITAAMYKRHATEEHPEEEDAKFSSKRTIKVQVVERKKAAKSPIKPIVIAAPQVIEKESCTEYYYGLGYTRMSIASDMCAVTDVSPNSPADRAGMQIDSIVLATDEGECPGRGPDGTKVEVRFSKTESDPLQTVILTREKICTEK